MPCACVALNDTEKVEFVNDYLCTLLGYTTQELLDNSLEKILTVSSRIFYQTHFFPLLRLNGEVKEIFLTLRACDGSPVPVMVNGKRLTDELGTTNVCILFPVWERKKYENELLNAKKVLQKALEENEMLNQFKQELEKHQIQLDRQISTLIQRTHEYVQMSKVLSHDMQEPIRKVEIFVDLLANQHKLAENPELTAPILKIRNALLWLKTLTHSLQQFVSIESNDEPVRSLDMNLLVRTAMQSAILATGFKDVSIFFKDIPALEGRSSQLSYLFTELFQNAIHNRKPDRPLEITLEAVIVEENTYQFSKDKYQYQDHLKLEITDTGVGFENRFSSYVFGLFNKLDRNSGGAGMGLSLCKQIVSQHFGTIHVRSQAGVGSTFVICLPMVQPSLQKSVQAARKN